MANANERTSFYLKDFFYGLWKILQKENKSIEECIIFHVEPQLCFFSSDISHSKRIQNIHHVTVNFTGLVGTQGTLPLYLKEKLFKTQKGEINNYLVLYDWLQQRSLQLSYHAWLQHRIAAQSVDKKSAIRKWLNSLTGMSPTHPWLMQEENDYRNYFAAHFANPRRPQSALQQILLAILHVPIKILNTQGAWVHLPSEKRAYLGKSTQLRLGHNTICGEKIWQFQAKLCLVVGPVSAEDFHNYLPKNSLFLIISNLLLRYSNQYLLWDMQLLIKNSLIQPCLLSSSTWNQLGRSSFLGNVESEEINTSIKFGVNHYE